jgi:uncharacterized protein (TIGR04255 family)
VNNKHQRYRYKKAPLQEAIFEAKFSNEKLDVTLPGQFFEKVRNKFPQKNNLEIITITIGTKPAQIKESPPVQAPVMQAWNEERTRCLQIGPGIVTANDKKYLDWEDFTQSIELLLKSYFECTQPIETKKVGFRCINRFVIPEINVIVSDYFRIGLALPNSLQGSKGFDVTFLKDTDYNGHEVSAKIRFTSESLKSDEYGVAFILDIECFTLSNVSTNKQNILEQASCCHFYLKEIFESLLQDKVRILMEGVKV